MSRNLQLMAQLRPAIEQLIHDDRQGAAVALLEKATGQQAPLLSPTYWQDEATARSFEAEVAQRAARFQARRMVFATGLIIADTADDIACRAPNPNFPPREFENEVIWFVALDLDHGVDFGRVDVNRSNGVAFGSLMTLEGGVRALDGTPGYRIVRKMAEL